MGCGGAAAGTPVAGALSAFVGRADRVLAEMNSGTEDLARALRVAAEAYAYTDQAAAPSLRVG